MRRMIPLPLSGGIETVDWQDIENKPELYNKSEIDLMFDALPLVVALTQAQYNALSVYDDNTYYLIVEE